MMNFSVHRRSFASIQFTVGGGGPLRRIEECGLNAMVRG
jgi:hypothetical protein